MAEPTQDQAAADKDAAARREADLQAAADRLADQRNAEDEAIAQRRLDEDTALADARQAEDRVVASARGRVVAAAAAMQRAVEGGNEADIRVANTELQDALQGHLDAVPEPPPAPKE